MTAFYILVISYPRPKPTLPKNRTIPRLALNLPPLSKGGGLTAKQKLLPCNVLLAIYPSFFIHQTFLPSRRRDCHTNLSKTALSHPLFVGRGACPSRCIEVLIFSAFLIYQSSIADCNQFFILIYQLYF